MKFIPVDPPREFQVGFDEHKLTIKDCGRVKLAPDEQVTFVTETANEYDLTRKSWGFYATPSTNGRLQRFDLRAVLVKNRIGQFFVFLMEKGHETEFKAYIDSERLRIISWLDNTDDLARIEDAARLDRYPACPMCGKFNFEQVFLYEAPPEGEIRFDFSATGDYHREILRCRVCDHYVSVHEMDTRDLYQRDYIDATYGGLEGIRRSFERISALPPEQSDNIGRVNRILEFATGHLPAPAVEGRPPTVLDVGSGLCVFLHRMKEAGWEGTALDTDPRFEAHAREIVGVKAATGDVMNVPDLGCYDLITFNKVLEHIEDPIGMLTHSANHLNDGGIVYVEVPDVAAVAEGSEREEFFIEHFHIFSPSSLALLATRAGFSLLTIERLRDPSGKFTLRCFLAGDSGN